ncbi:MAG: SH3 domain-containing protein [Clostridia bacterium]|nr:SH3 domain-containing protein [Clostridia bacterium]
MKRWICLLLAALLISSAACLAAGESLYVDNRETDKVYPERLNMRDEPSKEGGLIGLYYTGTQASVLEQDGEYCKVEIAGVTGYMASEFLITLDEAKARYGDEAAFLTGRDAQVDLGGLWKTQQSLTDTMGDEAKTLTTLRSGDRVELFGIVGDWAYVAVKDGAEVVRGYLPLETLVDVDDRRVLIVAGKKADSQTNLYLQPTDQSKVLMALKNGTSCLSVFGRTVGQWRKVRVGGVTGWIRYTQTENLYELGDQARSVVPYYPLVMQTKSDALLYSVMDSMDAPYMTLGKDMKLEVLAELEDWVYVRTLDGGAGDHDSGDYGYMRLDDLILTSSASVYGVAQVDCSDLPAMLYAEPDGESALLGALCCGAQVYISSFTQTDYICVTLGGMDAYIRKDSVRILSAPDDALSERIPQRATVQLAGALRTNPDDGAEETGTVEAGERVYMLGKTGEWAYVLAADKPVLSFDETQQERMGFIRIDALNAPASTLHLTASANADKVNLREAPNKNGAIIGKVKRGERLHVTDYGTQWTGIVCPDGKRGYVMTEYLVFD